MTPSKILLTTCVLAAGAAFAAFAATTPVAASSPATAAAAAAAATPSAATPVPATAPVVKADHHCRDEANEKHLKGTARGEFIKKCRAESPAR